MLHIDGILRVYPSAADGVSFTPSVSTLVASAWTEIIPSTPEAWSLIGAALVAQ